MNKAILIPKTSVAHVTIGEAIGNYPGSKLEYSDEAGDSTYNCYSFADAPVLAFVSESGEIETLRCDQECIWKGVNLIGLDFDRFQELYPEEPDESERLLVETESGEQGQDVYDYDDLGLQLWVHEGAIQVVMISNFDE